MKKTYAYLFITLTLFSETAQSQTFQKQFNAPNDDIVNAIMKTNDGGTIMTGKSNSFTSSNSCLIIKCDNTGTIQWSKTISNAYPSELRSVIQTTSGNYLAVGYAYEGGFTKALAIYMDANGNLIWSKTFNTTGGYFEAMRALETLDGKFVIAGVTQESLDFNPFVIKIDVNGNLLTTRYDKSLLSNDNKINDIVQLSDSSYFGAGEVVGSTSDIYCVTLSKTLSNLSVKLITRSVNSGGTAHAIAKANNGDVILAGSVNVGNNLDMLVMKINPSLQNVTDIKWVKTLGGSGDDEVYSISKKSNGNFILTGYTSSLGSGKQCYAFEIDTLGNVENTWVWGGPNDERGYGVVETNSGNYVIAGTTGTTTANDIFLIQTNSTDVNCWLTSTTLPVTDRTSEYSITSLGATSNTNGFQSTPVLNSSSTTLTSSNICSTASINELKENNVVSIFPNPFSAQTTLWSLEELKNATIMITDILGQTVAQIKNVSGQTITFSRNNLASGTYFARLIQNNQIIATIKLVIID